MILYRVLVYDVRVSVYSILLFLVLLLWNKKILKEYVSNLFFLEYKLASISSGALEYQIWEAILPDYNQWSLEISFFIGQKHFVNILIINNEQLWYNYWYK